MPQSLKVKLDLRDGADFVLSIPDRRIEVVAGTDAEYAISLERLSGHNLDVNLTYDDLPSGATASFDDNELSVGESAVFTIDTSGVDPGVYSLVQVGAQAQQGGEGYVYAYSASSGDVQDAINVALDGDTVVVPAGSATWTGNVTIPSTKGISLIGAGIGLTNVNMGVAYQILLDTRSTNSPVRLSGFSFTNGPSHALQVNNMTVGATNFRIDHCSWTGFTAANCIYFSGFISGVMDNCTITNCFRPFWIDGQVRPQDITVPYDYPGGYAWKQPLTSAGAVYIEDCTISNTSSDIFFNCRGGARFVFRHNAVSGPIGLETHSGCTPGYRNPRWGEIYENTFNTGAGSYWAGAFLRSINGMYYNNTFNSGYVTMMRFDNETTCITCSAAPWPTANKTVYPAQDQIGAGLDTGYGSAQSSTEAKLRIWNNTRGGVQTSASNTACAMIAENRDFWQQTTPFTGSSGIGVGLLSARPPSGMTTGVCYWATDTNTLYRATGATTWETYYTPYTYPHPLQSA